MIPLFLNLDTGSAIRFLKIGMNKRKVRKGILKGPYCLLDVIGVEPELQGKGLAKFMIEAKLKDLDRQNIPCYLETSDRENLKYYEKFGFHNYHQYRLMTFDIFCMFREYGKNF